MKTFISLVFYYADWERMSPPLPCVLRQNYMGVDVPIKMLSHAVDMTLSVIFMTVKGLKNCLILIFACAACSQFSVGDKQLFKFGRRTSFSDASHVFSCFL